MCGDVRLQTLVGLQAPQQPLQRQYYWQYTFLHSKNSRCKSTCNCKRHVPSTAHKIHNIYKSKPPSPPSPPTPPTPPTTLAIARPLIKAVITSSPHRGVSTFTSRPSSSCLARDDIYIVILPIPTVIDANNTINLISHLHLPVIPYHVASLRRASPTDTSHRCVSTGRSLTSHTGATSLRRDRLPTYIVAALPTARRIASPTDTDTRRRTV